MPLVARGGRLNEDHVPAEGSFGVLLRRYRLASGLSQEELAQRAGLSVRALANMERGRTRRPYRRSVRLLADALALSDLQHLDLDRAARLVACNGAIPDFAPRATTPAAAVGPQAAGQPRQRPMADLVGSPTERVVPRELPAPVRHFTGRAAELDQLSDLAASSCGRALVICAVGGTGGVGKTALAVQWAHRVADRFPDGQLYVNLRGYDPDRPTAPVDALAGLLRTLGVPGTDVPDGTEDRARLYRSRLAGRRMLVLLDNARDGDQVRPLLPGDPACVTVVTSRDTLAGLVATDGARRVDLDVLPLADAVGLLRSLIGRRAEEEPDAAADLAGLCARLPLALRIAAELVTARKPTLLADLVAELAANRLDLLDAGEDRADVRAVLSWSVQKLPEHVAAAFGLIGLHPGGDFTVHSAAVLAGTSSAQADRILHQLRRASLLHAAGPGRYGLHDLLRAYAREHAAAHNAGGQCQEALTRLFDYYLSTAAAAMNVLFPAEAHWRPRSPWTLPAPSPEVSSEADARAWLDAERANLVAVIVHCVGYGWPQHAVGLTATLHRYLINSSHLPEAQTIYRSQLHAARKSGDLAAEASALHGLGSIGIKKGHFRDAAGHYRAALERYRQCGDREGEARVLGNLGITEHQLHNHQSAVTYYQQAIAACEDAGDSLGAARTLCDLAYIEMELGSDDQASVHVQVALAALRKANDRLYEAEALETIGALSLRRGDLTDAAAAFEQALAIFRRIDTPTGVASALSSLGDISLRQGKHRQAIGLIRQALHLYRESGNQHGEIQTIRTLAEALHRTGQPAAAQAELTAALRLATETGNTYEQASAYRDLAESYHDCGENEQALYHWQQALTLYAKLGALEADQVRSRLNIVEAEPPPRAGQATA
jgi:tetratricopeptide (TPR) repeat protein/transcriptional regulator with XRE-family HTH domain